MKLPQINLNRVNWKGLLKTVVIIVLALLYFQECNRSKELSATVTDYERMETEYVNKIGTLTKSVSVLKVANSDQAKLILEKDSDLKKLASEFHDWKRIVKWKTRVQIDSILIPYEVPVPCEFERTGKVENEFYSIYLKSNQNGVLVDSLKVTEERTTITGFKRKWFWGAQTYSTDTSSNNPYIHTENLKSYEKNVPVKWYESTWFKFTTGFILGAIIPK